MQALFERGSSYDNENQKYHSHYIIRCSKCRETDEVRFNRHTNSLPPDVIRQKFAQRGWVIGKTRQNDVCPQCLARVVTDRAARHNTAKAEAKRATADLVIAEGRAPHPAHSLTPDNVELSRQRLMLLDRTAEIYGGLPRIGSSRELINRIADQRRTRPFVRRIITMTADTGHHIEDQPMPSSACRTTLQYSPLGLLRQHPPDRHQ
jgi:hypothetical protein